MRYIAFLFLMSTVLMGCQVDLAPAYTHSAVFTIPFMRSDMMGVEDFNEYRATLGSNTAADLVAPQHVHVLSVRVGEVVLGHWEEDATLVVDDLDAVWVQEGEEVCAGGKIGRTRQARIAAYWGREETTDQSDISTVRVVRNGVVTDLSDVRFADRVKSALGTDPNNERSTDVNNDPCPFTSTEGEQE